MISQSKISAKKLAELNGEEEVSHNCTTASFVATKLAGDKLCFLRLERGESETFSYPPHYYTSSIIKNILRVCYS
ncbi:hypothetical protein COZ82_02575 [Candidatus Kaiserbacteria bacterium CG_4_8_14_3_um_filter_38_9]|uniref:Uncharacterized protein n=1 Tax=Candidatus Kaiserbacteria bacterium CG_4_8_14_3_um_filter_38_9 TaxID=1974599 RepID=A0A2M7INK7_9BACT|nr:MAG: hypothetical protein COZ82_02575 [Candidatus Kaiserbacteria bacterium CG_4_8_14_3_um_filter_38_9]